MAGAKQPSKVGTVLFVAENGAYKGCITIADEIKDGVKDAIASIKKCGIDNVVMLTGDKKEVADSVAKELGIDTVCAELMPGDKVDKVEQLLREKDEDSTLIFTGDGINDAPVLMRADVGIAMGNAPDYLKKRADYITDSVDKDGVVKALEHFRLI